MNLCVFLLVLVVGVVFIKMFYFEIFIIGEFGLRLGFVGKFLLLFVVNVIYIYFYKGLLGGKYEIC